MRLPFTQTLRRLPVGFYLAVAIALDTVQQLLWKSVASGLPDIHDFKAAALAIYERPIFIVIVVILILQLLNWLKVLDGADLSYAMPITACSYVTVSVLSILLLGEQFYWQQLVGISSIIAGVWCIAQTQEETSPS